MIEEPPTIPHSTSTAGATLPISNPPFQLQKPDRWLLVNTERSPVVSGLLYFWKEGDHGYTSDVAQARIFTREDAEAIIRDSEPGKFKLITQGKVILASRFTVQMEDLNLGDLEEGGTDG